MKQNEEKFDIYDKYEDEENLSGINEEEFQDIIDITEEQMEKHPDDEERILMEFCHMSLRNELIDTDDVLRLFDKILGMSQTELYKKYNLKYDGMYLRNQNQKEFIKIKRGGKVKELEEE